MKSSIFLLCLVFSLTNNSNKAELFTETKLPSIKIEIDFVTPEDGITLELAKMKIFEKLELSDKKRSLKHTTEIVEITTKELWNNSKIQLYKVNDSTKEGIAIIQNNKVKKFLKCNLILGTYIGDLDLDNIYEIYVNNSVGFGVISEEIIGYNISTDELYSLSMRMEQNFGLFIENDEIKVLIEDYLNPKNNEIGELELDSNYLPKLHIKLNK